MQGPCAEQMSAVHLELNLQYEYLFNTLRITFSSTKEELLKRMLNE